MVAVLQVGAMAAGSVEVTAWPWLSTATHSDVVGQEIDSMFPTSPIAAGALQVGVAAVGSVDIKAWPLRSIATQSSVVTHETADKKPASPSLSSIPSAILHVGVAAVGLVEVTTRPLLPTATHSEFEEHEIPHRYGLGPVSAPVAKTGPGDSTPAARMPDNSATNPRAQSRLA